MAGKRKRNGKDGQYSGNGGHKRTKKEMVALDLSTDSKPILEKRLFVETLTSDERRREASLYQMLGSEVAEDRIESGECIISCLLQDDGVTEAVLQRHMVKLIKGLASGRIASRYGFSLVVTELLGRLFGDEDLATTKYHGLTFEKVLGLLVNSTKAEGNISGQEERDHFFGLTFGLESFVKSQVLFGQIARWKAVLNVLLDLGKKKIWLRPQCGYLLVQALEQMSEADAETTLAKIADAGVAKTPEGVAAWLTALHRFPNLNVQPWKNPLSNKSLADLTAVLKESFREIAKDPKEKQELAKHASWSAQLHFVWDTILARFLHVQTDNIEQDFEQFWNRVVDDGLFSRHATDGQKFKGFMVFQKMLEGFAEKPETLSLLFSRNFMTCLLNQAAKEDRYLHRAAVKALKAIETVVVSHPTSLVPILASLLGQHGSYAFDQRTNGKTVDRLLQRTTRSNTGAVLEVIRQPLRTLQEKQTAEIHFIVRTYADYLAKILNAVTSLQAKDEEFEESQSSFGPLLKELASLAYSQPESLPKDALTDQVRGMCRSRLESSLARLARSTGNFATFCEAITTLDYRTPDMTTEIREAMEDALKRMTKLLKRKSKSSAENDAAQALAMLHASSIFQLYNEDPDAMEVLNDLAQFYDRFQPDKASKEGDESIDGSSELLIEILLSMVARPSSLTRQVSQQVFDAFTGQITSQGLELLLGPLASGESTQGQQELFNTEDDAMEVDGEGLEQDEDHIEDVEDISDFAIDSDVEFVGLHDDAEDEGLVEAEDADSGHDHEDADSEHGKTGQKGDWENPKELDDILGKILHSHRLDKDVEAHSSSSEGAMSDSEMFALEDKLAAAIAPHVKASQGEAKKAKKDAKQSVVNFKHRILDLVEIYMKNETLNPLTLTVLVPLLNLMRSTSTKALASKAINMIVDYRKRLKKARSQARTSKDSEQYVAEDLFPLLVEIHQEAGKGDSHAHAKAASAASLIVASSMFVKGSESMERIVAVYAKTLAAWGMKKSRVHRLFFDDWINWTESHAALGT